MFSAEYKENEIVYSEQYGIGKIVKRKNNFLYLLRCLEGKYEVKKSELSKNIPSLEVEKYVNQFKKQYEKKINSNNRAVNLELEDLIDEFKIISKKMVRDEVTLREDLKKEKLKNQNLISKLDILVAENNSLKKEIKFEKQLKKLEKNTEELLLYSEEFLPILKKLESINLKDKNFSKLSSELEYLIEENFEIFEITLRDEIEKILKYLLKIQVKEKLELKSIKEKREIVFEDKDTSIEYEEKLEQIFEIILSILEKNKKE